MPRNGSLNTTAEKDRWVNGSRDWMEKLGWFCKLSYLWYCSINYDSLAVEKLGKITRVVIQIIEIIPIFCSRLFSLACKVKWWAKIIILKSKISEDFA